MQRTLLAIGDETDLDAFLKFRRYGNLLKQYGCFFKTTDYASLLSGATPTIATPQLILFLFFPFEYWDRQIEPANYKGIYGNKSFYSTFRSYWPIVDAKIKECYEAKKIYFVNDPNTLSIDRDKESTKRILLRAGLYCPRSYRTRDIRKVLDLLAQGKTLYIKVRYGSMGKGITYLRKRKWLTNFTFRQGRILSRKSDYGWQFRDVTNNEMFLSQLLKADIIIEDAVPPWTVGKKHFNLRLLVCFGKAIYTCAHSNHLDNITTNVSQGGYSEPLSFLKVLPRDILEKAQHAAVKAAETLGLNFAGVDILPDPRTMNAIILEVNCFPGFPKMRRFNLPRHLVQILGARPWK